MSVNQSSQSIEFSKSIQVSLINIWLPQMRKSSVDRYIKLGSMYIKMYIKMLAATNV